jgi:hypothetical protein
MRRTAVALIATLVTTAGAAVAQAGVPAQASTARAQACATNWGTGPRHAGMLVQTPVRNVRAGQHACFDRLVIDLGAGQAPGYRVRYVRAFYADASGKLVPTKGRAKLQVSVGAPAAASFNANRRHLVSVAGFAVFRQVAGLGSFEGVTSIGIGLRVRAAFRVFVVRAAGHRPRLVIDVARQ